MIGSGYSGIVFRLGLPCTDRIVGEYPTDPVSKIMVRNDALRELQIADIVRLYDPGGLFTILPKGLCSFDLEIATQIADMVSAKEFNRIRRMGFNTILFSEYGGETLSNIIADLYEKDNKKIRFKIILGMIELFFHVCDMNRMGYVHNDIKPDNFVWNGTSMYLIDFGNSKKIEDSLDRALFDIPYEENLVKEYLVGVSSYREDVQPTRDMTGICCIIQSLFKEDTELEEWRSENNFSENWELGDDTITWCEMEEKISNLRDIIMES
jgi:serine/threonine protein kinase